MYEHEANGKPIEAGIISFKILRILPFNFKEEKKKTPQLIPVF
jgi:hypothetical protein